MARDKIKQRAYNLMYREKNKNKLRASSALKYAENRETICAKRAAYNAANPGRRSAYSAKWYIANREKRLAQQRAYTAAQKAADPVKYRKKNTARAHKNRGAPKPTRPLPSTCECCGKPSADYKILRLDHCHVSNSFRGWLCGPCNSGIGMLGDSIDGLMNAVRYLERAAKLQE